MPMHVHDRTHEVLYCLEGELLVTLDGDEHDLAPGDCVSIPAGYAHSYAFRTGLDRALFAFTPGGADQLVARSGVACEASMLVCRRRRSRPRPSCNDPSASWIDHTSAEAAGPASADDRRNDREGIRRLPGRSATAERLPTLTPAAAAMAG
jgi:Cupin domain